MSNHTLRIAGALLLLSLAVNNISATTPNNPPIDGERRVLYTVSQTRIDIVNFASVHTGVKYVSAGRSLKGFDCSGFTSYCFKYFDFNISASSAAQASQGKQIPFSETRPGDLIFFGGKKGVSHVAMVVENDGEHLMIVHSTSSQGVMIEDVYKSKYWKPKMKFARNVLND